MAISKKLASLLASSMFSGMPPMGVDDTEDPVDDMTVPMDAAEDTAGGNDEAGAEQAAAESLAGSSTPMKVTALRDRLTPSVAPSKGKKVLAAISDLIAGGLMGGAVANQGGGGGGDVMRAAAAGFGGAQQNQNRRMALADRAEDREFGRQAALYNADVQMAQKQAMEDRMTAESKAKSDYFKARGENYQAMAKKTLKMLELGLIQAGGKILQRLPDGTIHDITDTPVGKIVSDAQDVAKAIKTVNPNITDKELGNAVMQKIVPGYKTEEEKAKKTPAQVKADQEREVKKNAGALLVNYPSHDAAIDAAKRIGQADPEYPTADVVKWLIELKTAAMKANPRPTKSGSPTAGIAIEKRRAEVSAKAVADALTMEHGGAQEAYDNVTKKPMPAGVSVTAVQEQLRKAGAKATTPGKTGHINWAKPKSSQSKTETKVPSYIDGKLVY